MEKELSIALELDLTVRNDYDTFLNEESMFALLLSSTGRDLKPTVHIPFSKQRSSFQTNLNALEVHLDPRVASYIFLRRNDTFIAITFVPYLAPETQRRFLLDNRHEFLRQLGERYFAQSLICKEISEVAYARTWEEREEHIDNQVVPCDTTCVQEKLQDTGPGVQDIGYRRSKCRACDRRMKNKISADAMEALDTLSTPRSFVQLKVEAKTEHLVLISAFTYSYEN